LCNCGLMGVKRGVCVKQVNLDWTGLDWIGGWVLLAVPCVVGDGGTEVYVLDTERCHGQAHRGGPSFQVSVSAILRSELSFLYASLVDTLLGS
jgi:hypothetical protein